MIKNEKKQEEARLDTMMEIERVRDLKRLEDREKKRIEGQPGIFTLLRAQLT